jgi:hypothetical protein
MIRARTFFSEVFEQEARAEKCSPIEVLFSEKKSKTISSIRTPKLSILFLPILSNENEYDNGKNIPYKFFRYYFV